MRMKSKGTNRRWSPPRVAVMRDLRMNLWRTRVPKDKMKESSDVN